jgi:hypothetical protein
VPCPLFLPFVVRADCKSEVGGKDAQQLGKILERRGKGLSE